jgi:predicted transcriptional regulator
MTTVRGCFLLGGQHAQCGERSLVEIHTAPATGAGVWRELRATGILLRLNNRAILMSPANILSISLPTDLRHRLDAEAERQRRSRSFLVREAVREYLARQDRRGFSEARERTLREGLALPPSERVRLSEELWADLARGHDLATPWTAAFDTFDEYERWRRRRGARAG